MIQLTRKVEFEAAHFYALPGATDDENRATFGSTANLHGHNWVLCVSVMGEVDPKTGMVVNIKEIDGLLERRIVAQLDHRCLNMDHPHFRDRLPTCENLAEFVWHELEEYVPSCRLSQVRLVESDLLWAEFRGETAERSGRPLMYFTRAYDFCASHRLHEPDLSPEENRRLFGKCGNPNGHGHNYRVEVTVAGELDDRGMSVNLDWLNERVQADVLDQLDFKHLNTDVPAFRKQNPTSENVVRYIYEALLPSFSGDETRLHRVRLYETHKSWFDYGGGE